MRLSIMEAALHCEDHRHLKTMKGFARAVAESDLEKRIETGRNRA